MSVILTVNGIVLLTILELLSRVTFTKFFGAPVSALA
jgi:hypothetical protein